MSDSVKGSHIPPQQFYHPQGFLSLAKNVRIKDATLDLTVIYSTVRAARAIDIHHEYFPAKLIDAIKQHGKSIVFRRSGPYIYPEEYPLVFCRLRC